MLRCMLWLSPQVFEGCEVTAYSAGHVLGAAILHLRIGGESAVYTGR
jgi:Cft2 family RNA processing exonuclease